MCNLRHEHNTSMFVLISTFDAHMQERVSDNRVPVWKQAWNVLLNILNFLDAALHLLYAWVLFGIASTYAYAL